MDRRRLTLKELEEKVPFPYPVEKCFMLKELIMNLARQGRIELDVDEIRDANIATIVFGSYDPVLLPVLSPRLKFQSTRGIY
ncbi:unnamed protein product [Prunus armeniaca]